MNGLNSLKTLIAILAAAVAYCQTTETPNQVLPVHETLFILNSDINQLRSEVFQMNGELKSTMTQIQALTEENELLKSQVSALVKENDQLKKGVSQLMNRTDTNNVKDSTGSVAFLLQYKSDWVTGYTKDTAMKFDDVILNVGRGYNPNTGIFTCPTSGLYLLSLRCAVDWRPSGRSASYTTMYRNDSFLFECTSDEDENAENDYVQLPVNLVKGDILTVKATFTNTNDFAGQTWTFMSGVLLTAT